MIEDAPPIVEPMSLLAVADPNRVFSANRLTPVSQQINAMEARLGITNHSGLSWESDGQLHVVRGRNDERKAIIDPSTIELDPRTGKPDPKTGQAVTSMHFVGPIVRKRTGLFARGRREVHETETELVNMLYVDVYEGNGPVKDRFVEAKPMFEADFDDYIDGVVARDRSIPHRPQSKFWWQVQPTEPVRDHRINVYVPPASSTPKADKDTVTASIRETQEAYGLRDWSGLTYRTYNDDLEIEQSEILRDVAMSVRTSDGWVKERYFEIQKSNNDGPISRRMVPASKVLLLELNSSDRNILDLHFRVNKAELDQRERSRRLGKQGLTAFQNGNLYAGPGMPLNEDQATDLLSGGDVYTGAQLAERRRRVETTWPLYEECALAIVDMSREFGTNRLLDLARRIKSNYVADANRIGLSPEDDSINWALFELGKQYHFAHHPDELLTNYPKYIGIQNGSPLGYDSAHRQKQQELIDQRVGEVFANWFVKTPMTEPKEVFTRRSADTYTKQWRDKYTVIKDPKQMLDLKIGNKGDISVKNQIEAILGKITPEDRELSYEDQVEIGRLLRREFAH